MDKNVFEKRAEELQKYKRIDETIFPETRAERKIGFPKYKAPYIPPAWLENLSDLNHRQKIDKVDPEFVRLNIRGSGNEFKIISTFRFLGLIDEECNATSKLASLRVLGDDFKKNLTSIVKEAYHDLFSTIVLEVAKPENLINFFVQRYDYSPTLAKNALRFFIWLVSQTDIPISQEVQDLALRKTPPQIETRVFKPGPILPQKLTYKKNSKSHFKTT